jgi:hypothetical protein
MARISQFAKDLGISYNQAKDLINKGRKRRDGGSQILEKTMSETDKKKKKKKKNTKNKIKPVSRRFSNPEGTPITLELTEDMIGGRGRVLLPDTTIDPKDFLQRPFMPSVEGEDVDLRSMIRRSNGGSNVTKVNKDKFTKALMGQFKNVVNASTSGKITPAEAQKKIRKMLTMKPPVKKKDGGLGMQSVKYGLDNNPAITAADPKAKFIAANKKAYGGMPRMSQRKPKAVRSMEPSRRRSEPPVTLSPFKGVLKTSEGETLRNIDGTTYLVKPNPKFKRTEKQKSPKVRSPKVRRMRDGGVFRGCGAQVKGKKFKGIF